MENLIHGEQFCYCRGHEESLQVHVGGKTAARCCHAIEVKVHVYTCRNTRTGLLCASKNLAVELLGRVGNMNM